MPSQPEDPRGKDAGPRPAPITELPRRLAYLELDETDRQRLHELAPLLNSRADAFVETFYRHLFSFPETAQFLQDDELVARLKKAQQDHLASMLEAEWNDEYVAQRGRVGDAHAQVGINPQIFLGAYNQYLQFCSRELCLGLEGESLACAKRMLSLQKAVFLDISLTLEAYFHQATQSLRQALDLVYQANAELRQFAQLTSHDLKTPLATMANLCDEALDEFREQMPEEAAELIESASKRAFRMSATIDELLHSTMSLHSDVPRDVVDSGLVMDETVELIRPLLKQKKIQLNVRGELPHVLGDRARMREIFYNLLSNAVKFSDKSDGRIDVDCTLQDGDCVFCIHDNGPGIPADELERVFVPFRRLASHRDIPGSGLGLYFTKTMVEQQGGRVWVESEPGSGSRFYVLLQQAPPPA